MKQPGLQRRIYCLKAYQQVPVAQWIARWTSNPEVAGSNPAGDDSFFYCRCTFDIHVKHTSDGIHAV